LQSRKQQTATHDTGAVAQARVRHIDVEHCQCGGQLKRFAVIEAPAVTEKVLKHIGLDPPPPRAKTRRVDLFGAD
jgi:hypothetical protein